MTYKIVRGYFNGDRETILTDLSLDEAQKQCRDPETSSRTCEEPENVSRTEQRGAWFDGYEEE